MNFGKKLISNNWRIKWRIIECQSSGKTNLCEILISLVNIRNKFDEYYVHNVNNWKIKSKSIEIYWKDWKYLALFLLYINSLR